MTSSVDVIYLADRTCNSPVTDEQAYVLEIEGYRSFTITVI